MTILEKIIDHKKQELGHQKRRVSLRDVRLKAGDKEPTRDFLAVLTAASGRRSPSGGGGKYRGAVSPPAIIAEVKKASPSAGLIRPDFDPVKIAQLYEESGATAVSVLTDTYFFQGSLEHLKKIRDHVKLPLLQKDFTLDEYQLFEARAHGADAVLLIVRVLSDSQLKDYQDLAHELGMVALVEVHNDQEWERAKKSGSRLIGINNRDLDTFKVDLSTSLRMAGKGTGGMTLVTESGIKDINDVNKLYGVGFRAFLIGESFLRGADPGKKLRKFLEEFIGIGRRPR